MEHEEWSENFEIVLRTPTLRAGSQFRISKFEIIYAETRTLKPETSLKVRLIEDRYRLARWRLLFYTFGQIL